MNQIRILDRKRLDDRIRLLQLSFKSPNRLEKVFIKYLERRDKHLSERYIVTNKSCQYIASYRYLVFYESVLRGQSCDLVKIVK